MFTINDEQIKTHEQDKLNFGPLVSSLIQIIKEQEPPFAIGLFGSWGSGKTSLLELLFERLKEEKGIYKPKERILIDVWRFPGLPMCRKLLIEIAKVINRDLVKKVERDLYFSITGVDEQEIKKARSSAIRTLVTIFVIIVIAGAALHVPIWRRAGIIQWILVTLEWLAKLSWAPLLVAILTFFLSAISKISDTKIQKTAMESEDQLEQLFNDIIQNRALINKKLMIYVDNLDRLSNRDVIMCLEKIKTFFLRPHMDINERSPCIFIVACDEKRVIEAFDKSSLRIGTEDGKEYLDKFFPYQICVPPLRTIDVRKYAEEILEENDNEIWHLEKESRDAVLTILCNREIVTSLRKFKKIANAFNIWLDNAKQRGVDFKYNNDFACLAKLIVLRHEFPDFFITLLDNFDIIDIFYKFDAETNNLSSNEKLIKYNTANERDKHLILQFFDLGKDELFPKDNGRLIRFLRATDFAQSEIIENLIFLSPSIELKEISYTLRRQLENYMIGKDIQSVRMIFQQYDKIADQLWLVPLGMLDTQRPHESLCIADMLINLFDIIPASIVLPVIHKSSSWVKQIIQAENYVKAVNLRGLLLYSRDVYQELGNIIRMKILEKINISDKDYTIKAIDALMEFASLLSSDQKILLREKIKDLWVEAIPSLTETVESQDA